MSNQVGDSPKLQVEPKVTIMPLDSTTLAELQDGDNPVNNSILSGKCAGGMVYLPDTNDIAIALGSLPTSEWRLCSTGVSHTPSTPTAFASTLGDKRRKHKRVCLVSNEVPLVSVDDVRLAAADVNTHNLSGKDRGSLLITETGSLYMALGSEPTDLWQSFTYNRSNITPTGDLRPPFNTSLTGDKARPIASSLVVPNLGISVALTAEVSDKDSVINSKYLSGKRKGAMCLAYFDANGNPAIIVAHGPESTDSWSLISTTTTITPA